MTLFKHLDELNEGPQFSRQAKCGDPPPSPPPFPGAVWGGMMWYESDKAFSERIQREEDDVMFANNLRKWNKEGSLDEGVDG